MTTLGYFATVLMGLTLGLFGGGGSILTIPILVYLFGIAPVLAGTYSLFLVGLAAAVGMFRSIRRGLVEPRLGFAFAAPSLAGTLAVRRILLPALPEQLVDLGPWQLTRGAFVMGVFAVLMVLAAASLLKPASQRPSPRPRPGATAFAAQGMLIGAVTGFVGAGGGFLITPALMAFGRLPLATAAGTSLMILALNGTLAFAADAARLGAVDWRLLATLAALALAGIVLGIELAPRMPEARLKRAFGLFVLVTGSLILAQQMLRG